MTEQVLYTRRNLELQAAEYYTLIRKPESEWETIRDIMPQITEFEHYIIAEQYDGAASVLDRIDFSCLYKWGYYARLVEMRTRLVDQLMDPGLQIKNLGSLGNAYRILGQAEQAVTFYEKALVVAHKTGERRYEGVWLGFLSRAYRSLGQFERSAEACRKALAIARDIGDYMEESRHLGNLGSSCRSLGKTFQAIEYFHSALDIVREIGNRQYEGIWLGCLGKAFRDLGETSQAIDACKEALSIARETGARQNESSWLRNLGIIYHSIGQNQQAIEFLKQALSLAREIGDKMGESASLLELGRASLNVEAFYTAYQYSQQAIALDTTRVNYKANLVLSLILLHQHDVTVGRAFADAVMHSRVALDKSRGAYEPWYTLATALVGQAICDSHWGQKTERAKLLVSALTTYHRALEISSAPGIVQNAIHDLELIRAAGIEGLEPVFELLEGALNE